MEKKEVEASKKRKRGRQKIAIEKIANKNNLKVTFSKRRGGIFKKATDLTALSGARVAIIVQSPGGKFFSFGNPSVDSVIHRYETGGFAAGEKGVMGNPNWWEDDVCLENLGLEELEECMAAMQVLKNNLLKRVDHLGMAANSSYDDLGIAANSVNDDLGMAANSSSDDMGMASNSSSGDMGMATNSSSDDVLIPNRTLDQLESFLFSII